jgi:PEP-CTERM motif
MLFVNLTKTLVALSVILVSTTVFADFMAVPNLPVGSEYRLAFVTNGARNAESLLIGDYNAFVTAQANQNATLLGLGTTWSVIGSTSTVDARDNTNTNPSSSIGVPIYRLDGVKVADNNADLWDGALLDSISLNQNGAVMMGAVWTGTGTNGVGVNPFQLGVSETQYGVLTATNNTWISFGSDLSDGTLRMYAMSAVLTVLPIPEPGSILLVGVGSMLGVLSRRHRKTRII